MNPKVFLATDVYTPNKPAKITFVERKSLDAKLIPSLSTPGKQIVIYGHSGSGKTTLLVNKLQQLSQGYLTTRCMSGMTFEQIVLDAFDQLGMYYDAETTDSIENKVSAALQVEYAIIKAQIGGEISGNSQIKSYRILPPQLTPQTLGKFLGTVKNWWILEDFHRIDEPEKQKLAQVMKVFMDMSNDFGDLKIIALGAVNTARQIISYNSDMRHRVSEIRVPLLSHKEMKEIIQKGEDALNFNIPAKVQTALIHYSNGLGTVCHQLCLNICFASEITQSLPEKVTATEEQLSKAVEMYMENASDTLKDTFDRAFRQLKKRTFDNGKLILGALTRLSQDGATFAEISTEVKKAEPKYPPGNLTRYLNELQTEKRGAVIRYDSASGKYSFSDPIYRAYATFVFKTDSTFLLVANIRELTDYIKKLLVKP